MREPTSWDDLWMGVARLVGQRSKCANAQYGAVIVSSDNRVLSVGYNGPPAGKNVEGLCTSWCDRGIATAHGEPVAGDYLDCDAVHAEMNALLRASNLWLETNAKLYVNGVTCHGCALAVSNSGIKRVTLLVTPYELKRDPNGTAELLRRYGLEVEMMNEPW